VGGGEIGHFDAIIPRIGGAGGQAPALIRQFETMGGYALNSGDALERLQYPATVIQALVGAGVAAPLAVVALDGAGAAMLVRTPEETLRLLVVDHKTVAAIAVRRGRLKAFPGRVPAGVRRVARLATRALRLGLAAVDVAALGQGFAVVGVTAAPLLSPFERLSGVDAAAPIIAAAEAHVRSWSRRAGDDAETGSGAAGG
jgi:glutathione synthase/RimK-type ligase-like ATP-grasp enzyme